MKKFTLHCLQSAKKFPVEHAVTNIGRSSDCLIQTPKWDKTASRVHASLVKTHDENWIIADLHSLNGVYLNGERVSYAEVQNEDIIKIGKMEFLAEFI